jgi:molybdopterin-synthase adenylyltransferase
MKPIVYIHKEKLVEAAINAGGTIFSCIGYEWPEEFVFHIHIETPPYKVFGSPINCFIKYIEETDTSFDQMGNTDIFLAEALSFISKQETKILAVLVCKKNENVTVEVYYKTQQEFQICEVCCVPSKEELYSRSKGLLEIGVLSNKKVLLIGLGSFGAQIALELAKAGVGTFTLVDFDRIELSNIARHICGVNELGRLKTHAVKDAVLLKNPFADVNTIEADINSDINLLRNLIHNHDITICVTDNNRSRFNVNMLAVELDKTVLFGRAITRAEGGDVFKLNGRTGPCYCCLVGNDTLTQSLGDEEISSRTQADEILPAYTSEEEKAAAVQVGLSSDISPICNLLVKLALVALSGDSQNGLSGLANELSHNYYLWANRREKQYLSWGAFNNPESKPTILRWYGVKVPKILDCLACSTIIENE